LFAMINESTGALYMLIKLCGGGLKYSMGRVLVKLKMLVAQPT